jgi:hypothetical protein
LRTVSNAICNTGIALLRALLRVGLAILLNSHGKENKGDYEQQACILENALVFKRKRWETLDFY